MLKLGDFGQSSVLANTRAMVETFQGTPYYVAPELFKEQPYSFPSDVWSLGVLLYEMCCLKYPFMPNSEKSNEFFDLGRLVMKAEPDSLPSCFSETLKCLIKHLLKKDPEKRPSVN
jgi:NIMA (never in mitosis gene a)-related kinase 1/4/5